MSRIGKCFGLCTAWIAIHLAASLVTFPPLCVGAEPISDEAIHEWKTRSAQQVLENVAKIYRECGSYMDTGVSVRDYSLGDGPRLQSRIEFHTAFHRGKLFRFAFRRRDHYAPGFDKGRIIWYDGTKALLSDRDQHDKFVVKESLGRAVATLTGISAGTAHFVPALLMPRTIGGRPITRLPVTKPLRVEMIDGKPSYRIEGTFGGANGNVTVLWIDKKSFLLLRLQEYQVINGNSSLQTIDYSPVINEKIPVNLFEKHVEHEWAGSKK